MKVKELIDLLQNQDPESEVKVEGGYFIDGVEAPTEGGMDQYVRILKH